MKNFLMIFMLIMASATSASDSLIAVLGTSPEHPDNKDAAEFGLLVAAQSLSVVTKVELGEWKGDQVVSVLVAGKSCEITVNNNSGAWLASVIECQE